MRAELEDWYRFIRAQSHVLDRPERLFQLAANEPDFSPIARQAAEHLRNNRETRPWLRWINKPQQRNPCLVTLTSGGRKSGFAFSPDSTRIVTGWNDESMRVWNAQTGQSLMRLPCLTTPKYERDLTVLGCAFVDGGKRIVTYVEDDSLKLWDAQTGDEVAWLARHGDGAKAWCTSPDGRRVAASFWDNNIVKVWDTATGELKQILHGTAESFFDKMTISADNFFLACGSTVGNIEIWTYEIGAPVSTLSLGITDSFEFSPDEVSLLTSNNIEHASHLWNVFTGELLASFKGHTDRITACHFAPDGTRVITASWDKTLKLWSTDGEVLHTFEGHADYVTDCAFSPDSCLVVSASDDLTLKLWECKTGALLATFTGHSRSVAACAFSPDGKLIVSTSGDSTRIWDASARTESIETPKRTQACGFSRDGSKAMFQRLDRPIFFDVSNGKELPPNSEALSSFDFAALESDSALTEMRLTADGKYVIGVVDEKLKVFRVDDHTEEMVICDRSPASFCVAPDGRKVAYAFSDNYFTQTIKCFSIMTGGELFSMQMARWYGEPTRFQFTFDSQIVALLTPAGTLVLLDAGTGEVVSEFLQQQEIINFAVSPTEYVFVAGGWLGSGYILALENAHKHE